MVENGEDVDGEDGVVVYYDDVGDVVVELVQDVCVEGQDTLDDEAEEHCKLGTQGFDGRKICGGLEHHK